MQNEQDHNVHSFVGSCIGHTLNGLWNQLVNTHECNTHTHNIHVDTYAHLYINIVLLHTHLTFIQPSATDFWYEIEQFMVSKMTYSLEASIETLKIDTVKDMYNIKSHD